MNLEFVESLQDVSAKPLNNLSGAYQAVGELMDPRFGGNCIAKCFDVAGLSRNFGMSVQTLIAAKTHRACLITNQDGEKFFFDPSLMMSTPEFINDDLLMDEIDHDCINPCDFPAIFYSSVSLFGTTSNFSANWELETPIGSYDYSYNFSFENSDLYFPKMDVADRYRGKPDSLFLRFLNKEDGYLYRLQYMSFSGKIVLIPHFTSKVYYLDSKSTHVKTLISEMESSLDISESEIRQFFSNSHEIVQDASLIWSRKDAV